MTKNAKEQTKRQPGPHCARSSTDIAKVNTWIATSHIHAKSEAKSFGKNTI